MFSLHRNGPLVASVAAAVIAGTMMIGTGVSSAAAAKKTIPAHAKIDEAIITAFSGPESFLGAGKSAGVYPAIWLINHDGGVLGHQMGVVTADTRGDPADALPLVERFLGSEKNVIGITGSDSATMAQLEPLFNAAKIPTNSQDGSSRFDVNNYKYFWRDKPPDATNGVAMALWAQKQGYTRIALVFGTDATAQGDIPGILSEAKVLKLDVVANIGLTPDQPSYQSDAATLLADNPQVVLTESDATTAGTFFGDLAQLGTVPPIMGDDGDVLSTWMSAMESGIGVSKFESLVTVVTTQSPAQNAADHAYQIGVNHEGAVLTHPLTQWYNGPSRAVYDGVIIQALAMLRAKSVQPSVYNNFIRSVTTPGAGVLKVYTYAQGKAALAAGKKIEYIGATGSIVFNKYRNYYGNQAAVSWPTGNFANEKSLAVFTQRQLGNS